MRLSGGQACACMSVLWMHNDVCVFSIRMFSSRFALTAESRRPTDLAKPIQLKDPSTHGINYWQPDDVLCHDQWVGGGFDSVCVSVLCCDVGRKDRFF